MKSRRELVGKWDRIGGQMSTRNIPDYYIKENLAQLLENQETVGIGGDLLFEGADGNVSISNLDASTNIDWRFRPITMALMRRTFPDLFAHKVIPVQAMSTPVGLAYAIRYTYNKDGTGPEAGWDYPDYYSGYTGSTAATSAALYGDLSAGFGDGSGTGEMTSAADQWQLRQSCNPCSASETEYPQIGVRFDKVAIMAKDRKVGASFTIAAMQDIKAMQNVDIERDMIQHLQYEITAELDREIITKLKQTAVDTTVGGALINPVDLSTSGATGVDGRWSGEKYMNIVASIIYQANQIAIQTRRGAGNFVIVSNSVATALQAAGHQFVHFTANVNPTTINASVGKLNGVLDVYRDQYAKSDYALVGYKGAGISDGGIIFSPYVMGIVNTAISPHDFSRILGIMSRYAITSSLLGSGRYYRLIPYKNMGYLIPGAVSV